MPPLIRNRFRVIALGTATAALAAVATVVPSIDSARHVAAQTMAAGQGRIHEKRRHPKAGAEKRDRVQRNRLIARAMLARHNWRSTHQYRCLVRLWSRESGWNERAHSATGAHGIPQALPGSKMSSAGSDWRTNPETQIRWGLRYIKGRHGSPCGAWSHFQAAGWY
ncbi:transglycosylase SLT domain-containing protein [Spirillospora sp. CA-294931]|uniref:aggregation-promoting factor C-terminal-like domain-containing protein n=1 Tax=Spirillospora sp. CA-294931 TaxID=3240042 RepID=UPI003D8D47E8